MGRARGRASSSIRGSIEMRPRFSRGNMSLCHHIFLFIFSSHMALYPGFTIKTGNPYYESTLQGVTEPRAAHLKDQGGNLIFFLLSFAQTLRLLHGWNEHDGTWPDTQKEANEGIGSKQTAMTISTPPQLHNRSPPYILFLCHSRTGSEAPKAPSPRRAVHLYYASKHRLPSCVHVRRANVRWG